MKKETHEKEDKKKGEYVTLMRLAWLKGGGAAGLRLALKHASNAMLLGGYWVRWDDMSESVEFLNIKHQLIETFKKSWSKHKSWVEQRTAIEGPAPSRAIAGGVNQLRDEEKNADKENKDKVGDKGTSMKEESKEDKKDKTATKDKKHKTEKK